MSLCQEFRRSLTGNSDGSTVKHSIAGQLYVWESKQTLTFIYLCYNFYLLKKWREKKERDKENRRGHTNASFCCLKSQMPVLAGAGPH